MKKNETTWKIICAVKHIHSKKNIFLGIYCYSVNNIFITENIKAIIMGVDNVIKKNWFQFEDIYAFKKEFVTFLGVDFPWKKVCKFISII